MSFTRVMWLVAAAFWLHAAGPNPFLNQAKLQYAALDYAGCVRRAEQGRSWPSPAAEAAELHVYGGLCRFALGDRSEAALEFQRAVALDPSAALPPQTSPKVRQAFAAATASARHAPPRVEPPAPKPQTAPVIATLPERTLVQPPSPPRENRTRRDWTFVCGGIALGAGATGVGLGLWAQGTAAAARDAQYKVDHEQLARQAQNTALGANVAYGTAGAAALAAGILLLVGALK